MASAGARLSAARSGSVRRAAGERLAPARRPDLRVVDVRARSRRVVTPRRAVVLSVGIVVGGLLAIVVADDLVVTKQLSLTKIQAQITAQSSEHQQLQLKIAQMETPSQIVAEAEAQGMVSPGEVTDVPAVPLTTPLPEPKVARSATTPPAAAPPRGTSSR